MNEKLHRLVKRYAHEGLNIPKYILPFLPFYEDMARYNGYALGDWFSTWERLKKRVALERLKKHMAQGRETTKVSFSSPYRVVPSLCRWANQRRYPRSTTYSANRRLAKAGMVVKTERKIRIKIKLEGKEWKILNFCHDGMRKLCFFERRRIQHAINEVKHGR